MDVDALGLDELDRSLLLRAIVNAQRGSGGSEALAAALGERPSRWKDLAEPYL